MSPLARKIAGSDGLNRRVLRDLEGSSYYKSQSNDLHAYVSLMYISMVLGRYSPEKAAAKLHRLEQPPSASPTTQKIQLFIANPIGNLLPSVLEDPEDLNLSDISISEADSTSPEASPRYTAVLPNVQEDSDDRSSQPSLDEQDQAQAHAQALAHRPIPPEQFAQEFKKAQQQDGRNKTALLGRQSKVSVRRAAHQYGADTAEGLLPFYPPQRQQQLEDKLLSSRQDSSEMTRVSKPYGEDTSIEGEGDFISRVPTVSHSRESSNTPPPPQLAGSSLEKPVSGGSAGKRSLSRVKFDSRQLTLELDARVEARVKTNVDNAEAILEKMKELLPSQAETGEQIYAVLKEEYQARLRVHVHAIVAALDAAGEHNAIGLECVVRVSMLGQNLEDPQTKAELLTRLIREYRKNVEIKNREMRMTLRDKKQQKKKLIRSMRSQHEGAIQVRDNIELLQRFSQMSETATATATATAVHNNPNNVRLLLPRMSLPVALPKRAFTEQLGTAKKHRETSHSAERMSSPPATLEDVPDPEDKPPLRSSPNPSHSRKTSFQKQMTAGAQRQTRQDELQQRVQKQKAYARQVQKKGLPPAKAKESILEGKLVSVQKARTSHAHAPHEMKKVVSYKGKRTLVSKQASRLSTSMQQSQSEEGEGEGEGMEEEEGWLGAADLEF